MTMCENVIPLLPPNFGIIHLNLYKYTLMPSRFALCAAAFPSWHHTIKENLQDGHY